MKVVVVGGGIVGLCMAHELAQQGAEVTVFDSGEFGAGCSSGNAGWICPILAAPIPAPGVFREAVRLSLRPSKSPISIRPTLRPEFLRWTRRFAHASTAAGFDKGLAAMVALNQGTLAAWDRLRSAGVDFDEQQAGLLAGARSTDVLDQLAESFGHVQDVGYGGSMVRLDKDAIREEEPAFSDEVAGGLLFPDERHVLPESVIDGLVLSLGRLGVELVGSTAVTEVRTTGGRCEVKTSADLLDPDRLVVASGVHTPELLRPLNVDVPIESARGYSITSTTGIVPRRPLFMPKLKVGCSPFGDRVRFVGTFELGARDSSISAKRIQRITSLWSTYMRHFDPASSAVEWAGLRPTTPDGLPILSAVPGHDGIFVASGHGMLGVSLAPVSAELLTPLVLDDVAAEEVAPLSLSRFD